METADLLTLGLVFLAVAVSVAAFLRMRGESIAHLESEDRLPPLFRLCRSGIYLCGSGFGAFLEQNLRTHTEKLRMTLQKADLEIEIRDVYGATVLFALIGACAGTLLLLPLDLAFELKLFGGGMVAFCLAVLPETQLASIAQKRSRAILHDLPFAIDLLSSSMSAGLDFSAALRYLLQIGGTTVLNREFSILLRETELGKTRVDALNAMQKRIGLKDFTRFVMAVSFGMESGTSIIEIMRIQAAELRRSQFARAEQEAAKAPVKMIIPMALFILPSMFIIILTPIILNFMKTGLVGK